MPPYIYQVLICASITLFSFAEEECKHSEVLHSKVESLQLDKTFEDFISQNVPNNNNKSISVKYLLPSNSEKRFVGLVFEFNKKSGELLSVQPIFTPEEKETERIMFWAFDRFHDGQISFDSLWDVVTSCTGRAIDDKQTFQLLANGLSTYKTRNSIPIYETGRVREAIANMKKEKFVQNNRLMLIDLVKSIIGSED